MSNPRGHRIGPLRDVESRVTKDSGKVVSEQLSCGHIIDASQLKPWKQQRHCPTCRDHQQNGPLP